MKIAFLSDIHGNSFALAAVLSDIEAKGGVDAYCCLGDYAAIGPDPIGVLERLAALPNAVFIRGNTDRYITREDRPGPTLVEVETNTRLLAQFKQMNEGFAWTQGMLTAAGWLDWLDNLPLEHRQTLPDGSRLLAVHASPGRDESRGLHPKTSDEQLRRLFAVESTDLIIVGHTHYALERFADGRHLVNPGSLSNPNTGDKRACYAVLTAVNDRYEITFQQVAYDWQAVLDQAEAVRFPSRQFLRWLFTRHDD